MKTYIFERKVIPIHTRYILKGTKFIVSVFATHGIEGEEYANILELNKILEGESPSVKVTGIRGSRLKEDLGDLLFDYIGSSVLDLDHTPPEVGAQKKLGYGEDVDYTTWHITFEPWRVYPPYNFYEKNHIAKTSSSRAAARYSYRYIIGEMYMPFKGSDVNDPDNTFLFREPQYGISLGGDFKYEDLIPISLYDVQHHNNFSPLPKITVEAPETCDASGCEITVNGFFNGEPLKRDVTLYLKTDCGYLAHTKVLMKNGVAKVKFIPLGLESGDVADVKVGFKHFTNLRSANITVE